MVKQNSKSGLSDLYVIMKQCFIMGSERLHETQTRL